jgi:hypothetical protein
MLKRNFVALGEAGAAKKTIIWGTMLSVGLCFILSVIGRSVASVPHLIIPLLYSNAASVIARLYQLSKEAIIESEQYSFRSNLHVMLLCIVSMVATYGALFLVTALLIVTGIVHYAK